MAEESQMIDLLGVEFDLGRLPSHFVTPDWDDVFDRYPEWKTRAVAAGISENSCDLPSFIYLVCSQLDKLEARPGRDASDWRLRLIQHFGTEWLQDKIQNL